MIATVTLNPCIDRTLFIPSLTHGGMNRVSHFRQDISGKGINVSIALHNLAQSTLCLGFNFIENGYLLKERLDELSIPHDFINVAGTIRTNIKVFEQDTKTMTEFNQRGDDTHPASVEALLDKTALLRTDMLVLSGSLPQGVDADIYKRIIERSDAPVILDAEGECLLAGLRAKRKPTLIKPNLFELESAFHVTLPSKKAIIQFCRELIGSSPMMVCVSLGGDGALLINAEKALFAPALDVPVRGIQGAGDSLVAGLAAGIIQSQPMEALLRYAAAAAGASVMREGTLMCTRSDFDALLPRVKIYPAEYTA